MRTKKPPGDEDGDPTDEAQEIMSSMAWMISESMIPERIWSWLVTVKIYSLCSVCLLTDN